MKPPKRKGFDLLELPSWYAMLDESTQMIASASSPSAAKAIYNQLFTSFNLSNLHKLPAPIRQGLQEGASNNKVKLKTMRSMYQQTLKGALALREKGKRDFNAKDAREAYVPYKYTKRGGDIDLINDIRKKFRLLPPKKAKLLLNKLAAELEKKAKR